MKIGTQLEEEVYQNLKIAAAREKRAIGEVIQDAVAAYLRDKGRSHRGKSGLARLLESRPINITDEQLREAMAADYWDQ